MRRKIKNLWYICLFLLMLFHIINNSVWLNKSDITADGHCSEGFEADKHLDFYRYFKFYIFDKFIRTRNFMDLPYKQFLQKYGVPKGFVVPFLNSLLMFIGTDTTLVLRFYNTFYLIILIMAVFLLGRYYLDEKYGFLASFLVSMYPGIFGISRNIHMELALCAAIALTVYFLLKTDKFLSRKYSVIFALSFGISINIKAHSTFFLIPLLFFSILSSFKEKVFAGQRIKNVLLSFVMILIFSATYWWVSGWADMWNLLWSVTVPSYFHQKLLGGQPFMNFNFKWFLYYMITSLQTISFPLFVLFIIGMPVFVKKIKKKKWEILSLIFIPFIIFSLLSIKQPRYFFVAYPVIAVISSYLLSSIQRLLYRRTLIAGAVVFCLVQYFYLSYLVDEGRDTFINRTIKSISMPFVPLIAHRPVRNNYREEMSRLADVIEKTSDGKEVLIGFFCGDEGESTSLFALCEYLLKVRLSYSIIVEGGGLCRHANYLDFIVLYDSPLSKTSFQSPLIHKLCDYKIYEGKLLPENIEISLYKLNQRYDTALAVSREKFLGKDKELGFIYY